MNPTSIINGVVATAVISLVGGYIFLCEQAKGTLRESVIVAEQARDKAEKQAKSDREHKERADAETKRVTDDFTARIKRLRANSSVGRVPPAPSGTSRPDLITFDRADYSRAYGELVAEIRGGADEGTKSTLELDGAKRWAQKAPGSP